MIDDWHRIKDIVYRLKDLTTMGIANILATTISAFFWLYMAALLGTENYGQISYFMAIAGIVSVVSLLGSGNTLIVYTAKEVRLQATVFFIALISSSAAAFILFFFMHNIGVSLFVFGFAIFSLAGAEILGRKLYTDYAKYIITQRTLMAGLSIGLYFLLGIEGVILGMALSFLPYVFRIYRGFQKTRIDFSLLRPRLGFMMNSYILDLSRAFNGKMDKLIIAPLLGFAILGNYHLSLQILSLLIIVPSIVYQYTLPRDASGLSNKLLKKATVLVAVGLALLGMLLGPILLSIFFPEFTDATDIIRIVSLAVIPLTINLMYISKFLGNEKSKIVLISSGVYLPVLVLGIIILGDLFGVNGIAASLVLAAASESVYLVAMSRFVKDGNQKPAKDNKIDKL